MKNLKFNLFFGIAALGATLAAPAGASTISAVVNTGGTATFTNGTLSAISGWTLSSFDGFTVTSGTVTLSGGTLTFAGDVTSAGALDGYDGTLLTISLTGDSVSGTEPNLTLTYGASTGMLNSTVAHDLGLSASLTNFSNNFVTNSCSSGCSGSGSTLDGTYNVSSNTNTYMATATPEPQSFLLLGLGLVAVGILTKKNVAVVTASVRKD